MTLFRNLLPILTKLLNSQGESPFYINQEIVEAYDAHHLVIL